MTASRKTGLRVSIQAAPAAGSPAAPLGVSYYVVQPGEQDGAEHWPAGLDTLGPALDRLVWLSATGDSVQRLSVHQPGQRPHVMFEYTNGVCTLRPASIVPADRARKGA